MNNEYIRTNEMEYFNSNIEYWVPNIRIYIKCLPNINQIHPEYALNILSWNLNDQLRILILFVPKKHNIHIQIMNIRVMIFDYSNNRIYLCHTVPAGYIDKTVACQKLWFVDYWKIFIWNSELVHVSIFQKYNVWYQSVKVMQLKSMKLKSKTKNPQLTLFSPGSES